MSNDLSASLDAIRDLASRLNSSSNALGEIVANIERVLGSELNVGIPTRIPITEVKDSYLGYEKVGERFRIVVGNLPININGVTLPSAKPTPWSDCSRANKIEAAKLLPELAANISKLLESRAQETEEATRIARNVLGALTGEPVPIGKSETRRLKRED